MVVLSASCNRSFCGEFCTFCKRSVKNLGRPYGNELQLSNLEVIKA